MSTQSSDFVFEPKVWSDHIKAYFDKFLVFGAYALRNNELQAEGTGLTVNFPYFKAIGEAEEPAEGDVLTVDKLQDDSFNCTVFEVAKAVGFKKKAFKKSAATKDEIMSEAMRQLARVHAEKVDAKLLTEISSDANSTEGFLATAAAHVMTVDVLTEGRIIAFGDKFQDGSVCFMHSRQYLSLVKNSGSGFLKADANDPGFLVKGFVGRLVGMGIVVTDQVKKNFSGSQIDSKDNYRALIAKENAYGIITKQEMELDDDKDILAREIIVASNEWYGVKSFHAKVHADDKKMARLTTTIG